MKTRKKNTRRSALPLILLALTLITGVAKADTITTFDVFGTFSSPSSGTFSGTLAVDVTKGSVRSVDITFPGLTDFNSVKGQGPFIDDWSLSVNNSTSDILSLVFTTANFNSLVGFRGGHIAAGTVITPPPSNILFSGFSGTIGHVKVPDQASSLTLLGLGTSGLLALRRRWKAT